jgi:Flp pilus assembly protein TadG
MMRGLFGLVSLLIVAVGAVMYFQETSPVAQKQTVQNIETEANKAAATMQKSYDKAQAQVDAVAGDTNAVPATNAPPSGN